MWITLANWLLSGWLTASPVSISIPSIGLNTAMEAVGIDDDGTMQAPQNPDNVGWMLIGNHKLVLDGHVDWNYRLRAFGKLRYVNPGDAIVITDELNEQHTYTVNWSHVFDLDSIPDETFAPTESDSLVAITCGGAFTDGAYQGRRIVEANEEL